MATASNNKSSHFESIRSKIHVSIESAIKLLRDKETYLNNQLDTLQSEYSSQDSEFILQSSDETILRVNNTNKQIDISYKFNEQLYRGIEGIAKLEVRTRTVNAVNKQIVPDYTTKILPVKSCFNKNVTSSPVIGEFKTPWGLAIEPNSGNIYISDRSHYCVQVFDRDYKFLYKFSEEMGGPVGMCFSRNGILITQWGKNYITEHDMNGLLVQKFGRKGNGELEFNSPWGIAVSDVTGYVYICERENNRVQILNEKFKFIMFLGECEFKEPRDVKLTRDEIYILDTSLFCMHVFNQTKHTRIRSYISQGIDESLINPYFFTMDADNNLIITDAGNQCISIFSKTGVLIHKIGESIGEVLTEVMAVAMDTDGMIFCVSGNTNGILNIF